MKKMRHFTLIALALIGVLGVTSAMQALSLQSRYKDAAQRADAVGQSYQSMLASVLPQIPDASSGVRTLKSLQNSWPVSPEPQAQLDTVVTVQKTVTALVSTDNDGVSTLAAAAASQDILRPMKEYNDAAQAWNAGIDSGLGKFLASLVGWKPLQILNADGTVEYKTTIRL